MDEATRPQKPTRPDGPSAETATMNRLGPQLVHLLFSASKTVQVHDLSNRATQRVLTELMVSLQELLQETGQLELCISTDFLLINDVRIMVEPQHFGTFHFIIEEMKKRDVEAVEFLPGVNQEEMGKFLKIFFHESPQEGVFDHLCTEFREVGIKHVKLVQWVERVKHLADETGEKREIREESNQVFFRTVMLMGEVLKGIEQRRVIQFQKAERLTQQMVDIIQADESILVGLTSIRNFDEYTFAHSVNVCILSMVIADRLRFYKSDIARLGVAALLHDIGKTYIPETILNKPGKLDEKDWELMKYHTFFGVKELSRVKHLREIEDGLFVALQHHVHYDRNGYPQRPDGWDLQLFTRIVTVADYYDAMTTPRVYAGDPLTPDKALGYILTKSGQIFDPFITKVFIQAMGMYPVGTVVELDSGERAVVVRQRRKGRFLHRPFVSLLGGGDNGDARVTIDLTEKTDDGKRYRRSVVKTLYDEVAEQQKASSFVDG
ncbi:MAG: HD-GYP domain-containing protein [Candidatus Krumholzibacteria bacterium]